MFVGNHHLFGPSSFRQEIFQNLNEILFLVCVRELSAWWLFARNVLKKQCSFDLKFVIILRSNWIVLWCVYTIYVIIKFSNMRRQRAQANGAIKSWLLIQMNWKKQFFTSVGIVLQRWKSHTHWHRNVKRALGIHAFVLMYWGFDVCVCARLHLYGNMMLLWFIRKPMH